MTTHNIDLGLRCSTCNRFAYTDMFEGEYGENGYICLACLRVMDKEASRKRADGTLTDEKFFRMMKITPTNG